LHGILRRASGFHLILRQKRFCAARQCSRLHPWISFRRRARRLSREVTDP